MSAQVKRHIYATVGWTLALVATGSAEAKRITHRVDIDGARYRVSVEDGVAIVARKSLVVVYDIAERDRQRAAALKATGCRLVDEMPSNGGITIGKLDCSK